MDENQAFRSGMRGREQPRKKGGMPASAGKGASAAIPGDQAAGTAVVNPPAGGEAAGNDLAKAGMRAASRPVASAQATTRNVAETPNPAPGGESLEAMAPGLRAEDGGTNDQGERVIHIAVPESFFGKKKAGMSEE